jgi:hypothetical protein
MVLSDYQDHKRVVVINMKTHQIIDAREESARGTVECAPPSA